MVFTSKQRIESVEGVGTLKKSKLDQSVFPTPCQAIDRVERRCG